MARKLVSLIALAHLVASPVLGIAGSSSQSQAHLSAQVRPERYKGHQVWRLDWRSVDRRVKDDILDAVEVSFLLLSALS